MPSRHLATDEPIFEDAVLVLMIVGGVLELACSIWILLALVG